MIKLRENDRKKRVNPQAGMFALEGEIDHAQRVAPRQLYGLAYVDEIAIVEEKK